MSGAYHPLTSLGNPELETPINTCLVAVCREKTITAVHVAFNSKEMKEFIGGQTFTFSNVPNTLKDGEQIQENQQRMKYQLGQLHLERIQDNRSFTSELTAEITPNLRQVTSVKSLQTATFKRKPILQNIECSSFHQLDGSHEWSEISNLMLAEAEKGPELPGDKGVESVKHIMSEAVKNYSSNKDRNILIMQFQKAATDADSLPEWHQRARALLSVIDAAGWFANNAGFGVELEGLYRQLITITQKIKDVKGRTVIGKEIFKGVVAAGLSNKIELPKEWQDQKWRKGFEEYQLRHKDTRLP